VHTAWYSLVDHHLCEVTRGKHRPRFDAGRGLSPIHICFILAGTLSTRPLLVQLDGCLFKPVLLHCAASTELAFKILCAQQRSPRRAVVSMST
jgi:hypothetical protein